MQLVNYKSTSAQIQRANNKMSTSDTKVNSLCDDNLEGCKLSTGKKISDEELFKQPPTEEEDCPICFLRLPTLGTGRGYMPCCGKRICSGCARAPVYDDQGNKVDEKKCPFCRSPWPTCKEEIEWKKKRMELDDPIAIGKFGLDYANGQFGFPRDYAKALELFHRAAELGDAKAYNNIGACYDNGYGVEVDGKKARHYYELAAVAGDVTARHNLGKNELGKGNYDRALKHFMIAVRNGQNESLERINEMYKNNDATKEDYTNAIRLYQEYLDEIKSPQRDKAAAVREDCRYYIAVTRKRKY